MKYNYYAGIGSRSTPEHIQKIMTEIAEILERKKFILRSGGTNGADQAFERGVKHNNKEIFYTDKYNIGKEWFYEYNKDDLDIAEKFLKAYHPAYKNGGVGIKRSSAKKLLMRNTFQIFGVGDNTENSKFIICYTPDGAESFTSYDTGGSGQAIRIAVDYDIPVYNLKNYIGVTAEEMVDFILKDNQ